MNLSISKSVYYFIQAKAEQFKSIPLAVIVMLSFLWRLSLRGMKQSLTSILIIAAITLITYSGCENRAALKIEHIIVFDTVIKKTFKGKSYSSKIVNYKLFNYKDDAETQQKILAYLKKDLDKNLSSYAEYTINIFPAEDESDKIMLRDHPNRFYTLDNLLYKFWWLDGKLVTKDKYRDGEVIDQKNDILVRSM